jgi:hypothetical protein
VKAISCLSAAELTRRHLKIEQKTTKIQGSFRIALRFGIVTSKVVLALPVWGVGAREERRKMPSGVSRFERPLFDN